MFSILFISIAHALLGDQLHEFVGHEPSGRAFNEICLDNYNRPYNPMINMGAIMVTSLIKPDRILADRFDFIREIMKEFSGGRHVFCDMAIYKSEMEVGYRRVSKSINSVHFQSLKHHQKQSSY